MTQKGDIVLFHHIADQEDWPAMVVEERGVGKSVSPAVVTQGGREAEFRLRVFRPGSDEWVWSSLGNDPGQFSERQSLAETILEELRKEDGFDD